MANIPSQDEVAKVLEQNQKEVEAKVDAQRALGKTFTVPADGHDAGVVPEDTWQNLPGKKGLL